MPKGKRRDPSKTAPKRKPEMVLTETDEKGKATQKVVKKEAFSKKLRHTLKAPRWYKVDRLFSQPGKKVANIGEFDIVVTGTLYHVRLGEHYERTIKWLEDDEEHNRHKYIEREAVARRLKFDLGDPELVVALVPPALSSTQAQQLEMILTANMRIPALLLSDNVYLARLNPLSEKAAQRYMTRTEEEEQDGGPKIIHYTPKEDQEPVGEDGEEVGGGVRAEDRDPAASDLRSDAAAGGRAGTGGAADDDARGKVEGVEDEDAPAETEPSP